MTRGIHLRQLRNLDLTVLGVEDGRVADPEVFPGQVMLREADPVLAQAIGEAKVELLEILALLNTALAGRAQGESG